MRFEKQDILFVNLMIKYIKENKYVKKNPLWNYLQQNGCNDNNQFLTLLSTLSRNDIYGLINSEQEKIILTKLGHNIADEGFESLLKKIEQDEELDKYSKIVAIKYSKKSFKISKWALGLSIALPILLFLFDKLYFSSPHKENRNSSNSNLYSNFDSIKTLNSKTLLRTSDSTINTKHNDTLKHNKKIE